MLIGQKLKELRTSRKMSLTALSKKSGVQLATLSRIENLKMTGTLKSHMRIAKALSMTLPELYHGVSLEKRPVDKHDSAAITEVFTHSDKSSYEILTGKILSKKMMPILYKIDSGGRTSVEQNTSGTEKFVFVLEGKIEAVVADNTYPLPKYTTLYFDASLKHYFINKEKVTAKVICVVTPVAL